MKRKICALLMAVCMITQSVAPSYPAYATVLSDDAAGQENVSLADEAETSEEEQNADEFADHTADIHDNEIASEEISSEIVHEDEVDLPVSVSSDAAATASPDDTVLFTAVLKGDTETVDVPDEEIAEKEMTDEESKEHAHDAVLDSEEDDHSSYGDHFEDDDAYLLVMDGVKTEDGDAEYRINSISVEGDETASEYDIYASDVVNAPLESYRYVASETPNAPAKFSFNGGKKVKAFFIRMQNRAGDIRVSFEVTREENVSSVTASAFLYHTSEKDEENDEDSEIGDSLYGREVKRAWAVALFANEMVSETEIASDDVELGENDASESDTETEMSSEDEQENKGEEATTENKEEETEEESVESDYTVNSEDLFEDDYEEKSIEEEDSPEVIFDEMPEEPKNETEEIKEEEQDIVDDIVEEEVKVADVDTSGFDFSSMRLLVATSDPSVIRGVDTVVSSYKDMYLLSFTSVAEAEYAYRYYLIRADLVTPDTEIEVASGEEATEEANEITEGTPDDALTQLESLTEDMQDLPKTRHSVVALIDTGVSEHSAVVERVSVIGDDPSDNNGHGDQMVQAILDGAKTAESGIFGTIKNLVGMQPDVRIISIKALDENGKGDVSAVYAAMEYAIERGVDIINLSMTAFSTEENAVLSDIIKRANDDGITVVGAAGNKNADAKYYVPGNIDDAIIVGSCDENGVRRSFSNYGDTVDYNVVSDSTSEATAKVSGYIAAAGRNVLEDVTETKSLDGLIFNTTFMQNEPNQINEVGDGTFKAAASYTITKTAQVKLIGRAGGASTPTYTFKFTFDTTKDYILVETTDMPETSTYGYRVPQGINASFTNTSGFGTQFKMNLTRWNTAPYRQALRTLSASAIAGNATNRNNFATDAITDFTNNLTINYRYGIKYNGNGGNNLAPTTTSWFSSSYNGTGNHNVTLTTTKPTRGNTTETRTVSFNSHGGSISPSAQTSSRTISYTFDKWYTNAAGTGTGYASGASYSVNNSGAQLYAKWNSSATSWGKIRLPSPGIIEGYAFKGWYTEASGGSRVGGVNSEWTPGGNTTLHAQWDEFTFNHLKAVQDGNKVYLYCDIYTTAASGFQGSAEVTVSGTSTTVSTSNMEAGSWTIDGITYPMRYIVSESQIQTLGFNKNYVARVEITVNTTNLLKTAPFEYHHSKIHFDGNGSTSGSMSDMNIYDKRVALTPNAFIKDGYRFLGWGTSPDGDGIDLQDEETIKYTDPVMSSINTIGTRTLYAKWKKKPTGTFVNAEDLDEIRLPITSSNQGKFLLVETKSSDGYEIIPGEREIELDLGDKGGETNDQDVNNKPNEFHFIKVNHNGQRLNGATFHIWSDDNGYSTTKISQHETAMDGTDLGDGVVYLTRLAPGTYKYQETEAPQGYLVDSSIRTFVVDENSHVIGYDRSNPAKVVNPPTGNYIIEKRDSDGRIVNNAVFTITGPSNAGNKTTGVDGFEAGDGKIWLKNLANGSYTFREISAPEGYSVDNETYTFTVTNGVATGGNTKVIVDPYNTFEIMKVDENSNPIPGAEFEIHQGSTYLLTDSGSQTWVSDENGIIHLKRIPQGTWTYEETKAPSGCIRDTTASGSFTVGTDNSVTGDTSVQVVNPINSVKVIKKDIHGTVLAGAEFELVSPDGEYRRTDTSNQNGVAEFSMLPFGYYEISETKAPPGYVLNSEVKYIYVDTDGKIHESNSEGTYEAASANTITFEYEDPSIEIHLLKVDSKTNEPLQGAVFTVTKAGVPDETWTSGVNGIIDITGHGAGTYTLTETTAPANHLKRTDPIHITLDSAGTATCEEDDVLVDYDEANHLITFTVSNLPWEPGKVTVRKKSNTGEVLSENVSFKLYKLNGTEIDPASERSLTAVAGEPGVFEADNLEMGKYRIIEVSTTPGHIPDFTRDFEITEEDSNYSLDVTVVNNENELVIKKVNENNVPITDAGFYIYPDGTDPEAGFTDDSLPADSNYYFPVDSESGEIHRTALAAGKYHVREAYVTEPYLLDNEVKTFFVDENNYIHYSANGETPDAQLNTSITFKHVNYDERDMNVTVAKVDENGDPLTGAEFVIEQHSEEAGTWVTYVDDEGDEVKLLPESAGSNIYKAQVHNTLDNLGRFRIRETKAPTGHQPNYEVTFTVDPKGPKTQTFTDQAENPKNELKIFKATKAGHTPIPNVPFKIEKMSNLTEEQLMEELETGSITPTMIRENYTAIETMNRNTQADGKIIENELGPGAYIITETAPAPGYVLDPTPHLVFVDDRGNVYEQGSEAERSGSLEITVENEPNKLVVNKIDDEGNRLAGAVFEIWREGNEAGKETFTSQTSGPYEKTGLEAGVWHVKEITPPDPMYASSMTERIITVLPDGNFQDGVGADGYPVLYFGTYNMTIENLTMPKYGDITIEKYDPETERRLSGARFVVREYNSATGQYVDNLDITISEDPAHKGFYKTAENALEWSGSNQGKFRVYEAQHPPGFEGEFEADININEMSHWNFVVGELGAVPNENTGGLVLKKIDEETGNPIDNVEFLIWNETEGSSKPYLVPDEHGHNPKTGQDGFNTGEILINPSLPNTTYHYRELSAPNNYLIDPLEHTFTTDENGHLTNSLDGVLVVKNSEKKRYIHVVVDKVDKAHPEVRLDGTTFEIYEWDKTLGNGGAYKTTPISMSFNLSDFTGTDTKMHQNASTKKYESGMLKITENNEGKFKVVETKPKPGYSGTFVKEVQAAATGTDIHEFEYVAENEKIEVKTTAKDKDTGTSSGSLKSNAVIQDHVEYKYLDTGKTFTIRGKLWNKNAETFVKNGDGTDYIVEKTITIGTTTKPGGGTYGRIDAVDMEFTFDSNHMAGQTIVVYEYVIDEDGNTVAEHTDPNDTAQTIYYPFGNVLLRTGGEGNRIMLLLAFFAAAMAVVLAAYRRKKFAQ